MSENESSSRADFASIVNEVALNVFLPRLAGAVEEDRSGPLRIGGFRDTGIKLRTDATPEDRLIFETLLHLQRVPNVQSEEACRQSLFTFLAGVFAGYYNWETANSELMSRLQDTVEKHLRGPSAGGYAAAQLKAADWPKVEKYIANRYQQGATYAKAFNEAVCQLRTGTFPGIDYSLPDYTESALKQRWNRSRKK